VQTGRRCARGELGDGNWGRRDGGTATGVWTTRTNLLSESGRLCWYACRRARTSSEVEAAVKRAAVASDCGKHPSVAWLGTSWSGGEQLSTRGDCVWKRAWEVSVDVPREPFGGV
jgi:hypothetical protein